MESDYQITWNLQILQTNTSSSVIGIWWPRVRSIANENLWHIANRYPVGQQFKRNKCRWIIIKRIVSAYYHRQNVSTSKQSVVVFRYKLTFILRPLGTIPTLVQLILLKSRANFTYIYSNFVILKLNPGLYRLLFIRSFNLRWYVNIIKRLGRTILM